VQEGLRDPLVLGGHRPGEVERRPGDVGVNIHPAREDHHPRAVERGASGHIGDNLAPVDANVPDHPVDPMGGVVDLPSGQSQHFS